MNVLIDTDPGLGTVGVDPEDVLAITMALNSPELTVRAITCVYGNVPGRALAGQPPQSPRAARAHRGPVGGRTRAAAAGWASSTPARMARRTRGMRARDPWTSSPDNEPDPDVRDATGTSGEQIERELRAAPATTSSRSSRQRRIHSWPTSRPSTARTSTCWSTTCSSRPGRPCSSRATSAPLAWATHAKEPHRWRRGGV